MNDAATMQRRLETLFRIGGGDGADRPGLSAQENEAHRLADEWMCDAGLETSRDRACNLYGRLSGTETELGEIWTGSHLDSVPCGGRYDGALGVVAAIEAVRRLPGRPRRTIAVVAFRDEEGWRFGGGCFGSRALTGALDEHALDARDANGVSVREALAAIGGQPRRLVGWLMEPPAAFVELHVEQGPVLAADRSSLGVVDSIVGHMDVAVQFEGAEGHAGTTPMSGRRDAALCAAQFQVSLAEAVRGVEGGVATVGSLALEPGATNVIAHTAHLAVDARAPDDARLERLHTEIVCAGQRCAQRHGCGVSFSTQAHTPAAQSDETVRAVIARVAPDARVLASGGGHDAQVLGLAGVPIGMMFVRSLADGVSHSPREESCPADIEKAAAALSRALWMLGNSTSVGKSP